MQDPDPESISPSNVYTRRGVPGPGEPGLKAIRDLLTSASDAIKERYEFGLKGYETGFFDLDCLTRGLHPASFTILAARPAMGTTSLALNLAVNVARQNRKQVVFFSLETFANQLAEALITMEARVPAHRMHSGSPTASAQSRWEAAIDALASLPISFDDDPAITVPEMRDKLIAYRDLSRKELGLVIVDSLCQVRGSDNGEEEHVRSISNQLKQLAGELQVPVLALSRLRRTVDLRNDRRPRLSDLKGAGALERMADAVLLLYRDGFYYEDSDEPDIAEVIVARNRWGSTGTVKLKFDRQYRRFDNLVEHPVQAQQQERSWHDPDFDFPTE